MYAEIKTAGISMLTGETVDAEINVGKGIPEFEIVGLGDTSVHESRKRVKTAIINSKIKFPQGRITVNLAPANEKKEGSGFDLAIAVGILVCGGEIAPSHTKGFTVIGELSLDGRIRGVNGILPLIEAAKKRGAESFLIPEENTQEAGLTGYGSIFGAGTLADAVEFLKTGDVSKIRIPEKTKYASREEYVGDNIIYEEDMSDIKGQARAKRVMEIAACGGHNILLKGSPGCGKTMLACRMPGILPPMTYEEALEVTSVYSASGLSEKSGGLITSRPFRQIQRNITASSLIGGGKNQKAGEISLAHNGILFIDELAELNRQAAEALRQPLEEKKAVFLYQGKKKEIPADFMLVAAANPCKCGYLYEEGKCRCTPYQIRNYEKSITGPLADRIDIHLETVSVPYGEIVGECGEKSETIRKRVIKVREMQKERYKNDGIKTNSALFGSITEKYCALDDGCRRFLSMITDKAGFSMRSYGKILKISRTIADMDGREKITEDDIAEAVQYRPKNSSETV